MANGRNELGNLLPVDIAELLGMSEGEIPAQAQDLIAASDLSYRSLEGRERDRVLLMAVQSAFTADLKVAGEHRRQDWQQGWHENLREFIDSNYELRALIPKYFKPGEAKRLRRNYVLPTSNQFELSIIKIIRTCLAKKYFWDCSKVFEFGCGTGYHLVSLAQLLPQSEIIGLDWVTASVQIVQLLAEKYKLRLRGGIFDYYQPDRSLDLDATSAVFTFASLEQIGDRHKEFIDFILERKPKICLNVECLEELYDPGDLLDFLALHYHRRRGYLSGYLGRLRELAERGRVEIIEERRTFFGSTYHEAYAFVAWRPL